MSDVGKNLNRLCEDRGITMAELARRSQVPKATLHGWTIGKAPNLEQLRRVATVLKVSFYTLAFGEEDPHQVAPQQILKELFSGDVRITVHKIERG